MAEILGSAYLPARLRTWRLWLFFPTAGGDWQQGRCLLRSLLIGQLPRPPVHLSHEPSRWSGVRQARVRQPWEARPEHRGLRLICDKGRPTAAVPMHTLPGNRQHQHGDRVHRSSLHATGVRAGSQPTRRRREPFRDRQSHGIPVTLTLGGSSGPQPPRRVSMTGCCAASTSSSCRLMSSARWLATGTRPSGCSRPSRYRPACGPEASLGRRSDQDARAVINDVVRRGRVVGCPLIATDGFEYYFGAVGALVASACVYGQVLKTRRNNRVIRVERRVKIGTTGRLQTALWESEDSETLNTSFVERLNLTIRQASAYLRRRSPCHARGADQLRSHIELVRCHYNFVRPQRALRFGRETRTPAHGSRSGEHATGPEPHLHDGPRHAADVCGGRCNWHSRVTKAHVAARPTNGGLINSERRKHRRALRDTRFQHHDRIVGQYGVTVTYGW